MADIPIYRMHAERFEKARFLAIAEHLGLRGDAKVTDEAMFLQDKERALAYAMPGSRFAGLLFFTDQSQANGAPVRQAPATLEVEAWTGDFLKRFQLGPRGPADDRIRVDFAIKALRTEGAIEDGQGMRRVPVKTESAAELRLNGVQVTGPRAKMRLAFKTSKAPSWVHCALWERLEPFETRRMLTEDEAHRRVSDRLSKRGETRKAWSMVGMRLAYFAGEYGGGPDLLEPSYFVEVEFQDPRDRTRTRQGPRQLIRIPAGI